MKFCGNCGHQVNDNTTFCPNCGAAMENNTSAPGSAQTTQPYTPASYSQQPPQSHSPAPQQTQTSQTEKRSMPGFIIGLIGSIFGLFDGLCITACYSVSGQEGSPLFFMVGGSILGMIGACMCFKKAHIGSILMFVSAIMIAICAFGITGANLTSFVAMLMLAVGGIVGFMNSKSNN